MVKRVPVVGSPKKFQQKERMNEKLKYYDGVWNDVFFASPLPNSYFNTFGFSSQLKQKNN